jgi:hypothetical protein
MTTQAAGLGVLAVLALASPAAAQNTIAPGLSPLCTAVQTAVWNATDEAWERSRMRPGQMMCGFAGAEAFCVAPRCAAKAAIVVLPPTPAGNPGGNRRFGTYAMGPAPTAAQINDRYLNVLRATFSAGGRTTTVSVSSDSAAYAKALMAAIRRGFRAR